VAETLAGLVFARLVDPGVMAIFAPKPLVADLRTGSMSGGGGEQAILMAAAAQMGRHFDLPTSSIAGITDSKTLDAQYGAEKSLAGARAATARGSGVSRFDDGWPCVEPDASRGLRQSRLCSYWSWTRTVATSLIRIS